MFSAVSSYSDDEFEHRDLIDHKLKDVKTFIEAQRRVTAEDKFLLWSRFSTQNALDAAY